MSAQEGRLADAVEHELHGQPGEQDARDPTHHIGVGATQHGDQLLGRPHRTEGQEETGQYHRDDTRGLDPSRVRPITSTAAERLPGPEISGKAKGDNVPGLLRRSSRAGAA